MNPPLQGDKYPGFRASLKTEERLANTINNSPVVPQCPMGNASSLSPDDSVFH